MTLTTLILISLLTLGLSVASMGLLSRFYTSIRNSLLIAHLDQCVRAVMLAFAVYHIGYELLEQFSLLQLGVISVGFYLVQTILATMSQKFMGQAYIHERHPWLIYTLLIPHFMTEALVIAPQAIDHTMNVLIIGFLIHKVFEVAILTMNTNNTIHCLSQRRILQTILVFMTPITILMYWPLKTLVQYNQLLFAFTSFLNFIVFVQLSLFCKLCSHDRLDNQTWLQSNYSFLISLVIISIIVYFYPSILIGCCH